MAYGTISALQSPSVPQSLAAQGVLTQRVFALKLTPTNGELTLGGTDTAAYSGQITYTPVTTRVSYSLIVCVHMRLNFGDRPFGRSLYNRCKRAAVREADQSALCRPSSIPEASWLSPTLPTLSGSMRLSLVLNGFVEVAVTRSVCSPSLATTSQP